MSGRKINEKSVSIPEVKEIMENVKEHLMEIESEDEEEAMSHFQEITYQYVNKFSKMSTKDAVKIKNLLVDKYEIEEIYAINIVNVDPQDVPELRTILEKSSAGKSLDNETLQEILYQIQDLKTS